MHMYQ